MRIANSTSTDSRSTISALTATPPSVTTGSTTAASTENTATQDNAAEAEVQMYLSAENDGRDGGDSDDEGDEVVIHEEGLEEKRKSRREGAVLDPADDRGMVKGLVSLTATGGTQKIGNIIVDESSVAGLEGAAIGDCKDEVRIPRVPKDFVAKEANAGRNEPKFEDVDNPGNWPNYCFRPEFQGNNRSRSSKYKHHQLPTGVMPHPKRASDGKRVTQNGWEFHYNGWKNPDGPKYRQGATTANMFPKEMEGSLDVSVLKKLGLTKKRMQSCDAAFFLQLILPFCNPAQSGIEDDPRIAFFTDEEKYTNMSKYESGTGGSYGHTWLPTTARELVQFHGVTIRDGVRGGSDGAIHRRWQKEGSCYDEDIAKNIKITRFGELKRNFKLCHNGSVPKRGQKGYDPAYKYDLVYKAMVHNCNAISRKGDDHLTLDETTWGFGGYGEHGSGLVGRLRNKKVNKGGQTTIMSDSRRFRPRAYIHRHNLHPMIEGMSKKGTNELVHLLKKIDTMVESTPTSLDVRKLWKEKPTICGDTFFVDNKALHWAGSNGFGLIGTSSRNMVPEGIDKKYLHIEKHQPGCPRSKVARFLQPIVAVKNCDGYQRVHVSFQSTSSTNISTVNCLNECYLFVEIRERGRGKNKRYWGIEMNHGRRMYLSLYWTIDVVDHLLKNAAIYFRTWKYWHSPMNHGLALCIVLAFSIYEECCEGNIEAEWKVESKERKSYFQFREILSKQMLNYHPRKQNYPGDEKMRVVTSMTKVARGLVSMKRKEGGPVASLAQVKKAKRYGTSRLCGDLGKLCTHVKSIQSISSDKNPLTCAWCGLPTYTICTKCKDDKGKPIPLHYNVKRGKNTKGSLCFYHYHDDRCFGLGRRDATKILGNKLSDWSPPEKDDIVENASHIKELIEKANL